MEFIMQTEKLIRLLIDSTFNKSNFHWAWV